MKRTAFFDIHNSNGAKIVEFAGFEMPIEYSGIKDEHMAVRNGVGVFDVSHMGEFWVTGPQALAFIQKVTSNDASKLAPGQAQYSCLPNGKGGIVDDLLVYSVEPEKYMLVVNAANIEKDWQWLVSQNSVGAKMENASGEISQLAIQGPKATGVLQKLTKVDLSVIKYYTFTVGEFAGIPNVIISATGYTGAGGFELYFENKHADAIWNAIFEAGKEEGIKPIGLGARDTLRLEMGFCLYGNDIDDTTSPIEAGLGWITKFTDEKDFIDKDLLASQKEEGVTRRLRGFEMIDRGIPRHGYEIMNEDGEVIGEVTSGSMSPVRGIGIGLGYLKTGYTKLGTEIFIRVRNKKLKAKVVKLPFI
ncbi:glycine cleavage system aminomethyltransferase GcvT [Prolixibacter sp. SD074]|uniref:glycine cleavage system aminomethyltransferase GcvT n=1 Tax=Prolixibacter sp. SD074 TaxID=2652391 RepID=UPI001275F64E|nr:glycine cleavage system aminomethyltransferase GcvT [Prolixibacter sp. SD074]GET29591.1 aminomethyltransferase [Prolixibacter sp. SD074]